MTVKRIVPNFEVTDPNATKAFYRDLFGLDVAMDLGWIVTFATDEPTRPLLSMASEGGSGTPVPALSIEVDNLDEVHAQAHSMGVEIPYPMTLEPWGVRRFYLRDPNGILINVLSH